MNILLLYYIGMPLVMMMVIVNPVFQREGRGGKGIGRAHASLG